MKLGRGSAWRGGSHIGAWRFASPVPYLARGPVSWWRWETTVEISWYITNRVGRRVTYYAKAIRDHGGIGKNRNHRVRDGSLGEDASKSGVNPGIVVCLKSFALNLGPANGIDNIQHGFWRGVGARCLLNCVMGRVSNHEDGILQRRDGPAG